MSEAADREDRTEAPSPKRLREARDAAQKAVALGGPTLDTAQDTLRQIEARLTASASPRRKAPRDRAARR